jgi:hypothetical protein
MASPGLVILAVLGVAVLFVVVPLVLTTLYEARGKKSVVCPEKGKPASLALDPGRAARGAILGKTWLRVAACSFWPEKEGCAQGCVQQLEPPPLQAGSPSPTPRT